MKDLYVAILIGNTVTPATTELLLRKLMQKGKNLMLGSILVATVVSVMMVYVLSHRQLGNGARITSGTQLVVNWMEYIVKKHVLMLPALGTPERRTRQIVNRHLSVTKSTVVERT
jgi:hypothetical protein